MNNYDEQVAQLMSPPFREIAAVAANLIESGDGGNIVFQPGDATRYLMTISPARTYTISSGEPMLSEYIPEHSRKITFGTATMIHEQPLGRIEQLDPDHPWTAAIWRRILATSPLDTILRQP